MSPSQGVRETLLKLKIIALGFNRRVNTKLGLPGNNIARAILWRRND